MSTRYSKDFLYDIIKSCNDKLIAVDLDGVLAQGEFWGEGDPMPQKDMRDFLWSIYKKGAHIIIYTARQPRYYPETHAWLLKNEIPFHGIAMCMKPGADLYIDDKAMHPEDLLKA